MADDLDEQWSENVPLPKWWGKDSHSSGMPSSLYDETNPNWIPTLNLGYEHTADMGQRYARVQKRRKTQQQNAAAMTLLYMSSQLADVTDLPSSISKLEEEIFKEMDTDKLEAATAEISNLKGKSKVA